MRRCALMTSSRSFVNCTPCTCICWWKWQLPCKAGDTQGTSTCQTHAPPPACRLPCSQRIDSDATAVAAAAAADNPFSLAAQLPMHPPAPQLREASVHRDSLGRTGWISSLFRSSSSWSSKSNSGAVGSRGVRQWALWGQPHQQGPCWVCGADTEWQLAGPCCCCGGWCWCCWCSGRQQSPTHPWPLVEAGGRGRQVQGVGSGWSCLPGVSAAVVHGVTQSVCLRLAQEAS